MNQEDKYLDHLFKTAREEESQLSYEEVAEVFSASTTPALFGIAKGWFFRNINLNSILLLSTGTLIVTAFFLLSHSTKSDSSTLIKTSTVTNHNSNTSSFPKEKELIKETTVKNNNNTSSKNIAIKTKAKSFIKPVSQLSDSQNKEESKTVFIADVFDKEIISVSPILASIKTELNWEKPGRILFSKKLKKKNPEKDKDDLSDSFSPWIVGEKSEMPWQIKRNGNLFIPNETERVLQQFMDTKYLEQIFERKGNGFFKPLIIVAHYYIDENYYVNFKGEKIRILPDEIAPDFEVNQSHLNLKKFRIRKNKAIMNFTYGDYQVFMQLKRVGEGWKRSKIKVKKNKKLHINIDF